MTGEEKKMDQSVEDLNESIKSEFNKGPSEYSHLANYKDRDNFGQIVQNMTVSVDLALPFAGMTQADLPSSGQDSSMEAVKINAVVELFKGMNQKREGLDSFNDTIEAYGGQRMDTDTYDSIRERVEQIPDSDTIGSNFYLEAKKLEQKSSGSDVSKDKAAEYVPTLENDSQVLMEVAGAAVKGMSVDVFTDSIHSTVSSLTKDFEPVTPESLGEEFSKEFSKKMKRHVSDQWDHLDEEKAEEVVSSLVKHPHFDLEDAVVDKLNSVRQNGQNQEAEQEVDLSIPLIDTPDEQMKQWNQEVKEQSALKVISSAVMVKKARNKLSSLKENAIDDGIREAFAKEAREEEEKARQEDNISREKENLIPTPEVTPEMEGFIQSESQNVQNINNAAKAIQTAARVLKAKNQFKSKLKERNEQAENKLRADEESNTRARIEEGAANGQSYIPGPESNATQEIDELIAQSNAAKVIQKAARDKLVGQRKRPLEDDTNSIDEVNGLIADETIDSPAKEQKLEGGNKARQETRQQMAKGRKVDIAPEDELFKEDYSRSGMSMEKYNEKVVASSPGSFEPEWQSFAGSAQFDEASVKEAASRASDEEKVPFDKTVFPKQQNVDFDKDTKQFESDDEKSKSSVLPAEERKVSFAPGTIYKKGEVEPETVVEAQKQQKAPTSEVVIPNTEEPVSDLTIDGKAKGIAGAGAEFETESAKGNNTPAAAKEKQSATEVELTYTPEEVSKLNDEKDRLENGSKKSRFGIVVRSAAKETDDLAKDTVGVPLLAAFVAVPKSLGRSAVKGVRNIIGEGNSFLGINGRKRLNTDRKMTPDRSKSDEEVTTESAGRIDLLNQHIGNAEQAKKDLPDAFENKSNTIEKVGIKKSLGATNGDYSESWVKYASKSEDGKQQSYVERYDSNKKSSVLEL